jgi:hypothetical protein
MSVERVTYNLVVDRLVHKPLAGAVLLAVTVVAGRVFLWREKRRPAPLVSSDLLGIRSLVLSALASLCVLALIALPFHFHDELGPEVMQIGSLMTVWPLAIAFEQQQPHQLVHILHHAGQ